MEERLVVSEVKWKEIDDFDKFFNQIDIVEYDQDYLYLKIREGNELVKQIEAELSELDLWRKKETLERYISRAHDIAMQATSSY